MKYSAVVVASAAVALAQTVPSSNTCDQLEAIETRCNESAKADVVAHAACMCSNNQEFFTLWAKCRQQIQDAPEWLEVNSATKADLCGGSPSGLYQGVFRKITEGKGLENNPGAAESSAPSTPSGSSLPVMALKEADAVEKDVYAEEDDVPPVGTSFAGVDEDGVAEAEDDVLAPATTFTSTFAPGSTGSSFGTPGTAGGAGVFGNSTHTGPTAAASTGKASSGMSFALVGAVLMLAL